MTRAEATASRGGCGRRAEDRWGSRAPHQPGKDSETPSENEGKQANPRRRCRFDSNGQGGSGAPRSAGAGLGETRPKVSRKGSAPDLPLRGLQAGTSNLWPGRKFGYLLVNCWCQVAGFIGKPADLRTGQARCLRRPAPCGNFKVIILGGLRSLSLLESAQI